MALQTAMEVGKQRWSCYVVWGYEDEDNRTCGPPRDYRMPQISYAGTNAVEAESKGRV